MKWDWNKYLHLVAIVFSGLAMWGAFASSHNPYTYDHPYYPPRPPLTATTQSFEQRLTDAEDQIYQCKQHLDEAYMDVQDTNAIAAAASDELKK
jgi:hypothetical protein